jgi:hypothetical protein
MIYIYFYKAIFCCSSLDNFHIGCTYAILHYSRSFIEEYLLHKLTLAGDMMVMRLCLERISPPRKDHPFKFTLPEKTSSYDTADMISGMLRIVASGEVTPDEAN